MVFVGQNERENQRMGAAARFTRQDNEGKGRRQKRMGDVRAGLFFARLFRCYSPAD